MQAAALVAAAGPLPPLTGAVQAAMEQMRDVMCPRLVPEVSGLTDARVCCQCCT